MNSPGAPPLACCQLSVFGCHSLGRQRAPQACYVLSMKSIAAVFLFAASQVLAQPSAPVAPPKPIVIRAARLFDGRAEALISNGAVVVQGNRIVAAGANVAIPANAQIIDLGDATLLPGLIDAHVHLTEENGDNFYLQYFQNMMRQPAE